MRIAYSGPAGESSVRARPISQDLNLEKLYVEDEDEWCRLLRFYIWIRDHSDEFKSGFFLTVAQAAEFDHSYQQKLQEAHTLIQDGKAFDVTALKKTLIDFLNGHISTESAYTKFEDDVLQLRKFHGVTSSTFLPDNLYPRDVLDAIRRHGKSLFGVDRLEVALEKRFDVEIETESFNPFLGKSCLRGAMHFLRQDMQEMNTLLAFIPEELRRAAYLKKIYLTSENIIENQSLEDDNPEIKYLGGVAVPGHFIYARSAKTFFHEFFHCLDFADGMIFNDLEYLLQSYHLRGGLKLYSDLLVDKLANAILPGLDLDRRKKDKEAEVKDRQRPESFSSRYGFDNFRKSGLWTEDQADLAAYAICGSLSHYLHREIDPAGWQKLFGKTVTLDNDPVLVGKMRWLKQFLYKKSGGLWDDAFWLEYFKAGDMSRFDETYWEQKRKSPKHVLTESAA